ncbi:hypothetical protein [Roseovarius salinarum]|uniref:hypothetical protein n=1 Tax=Roseovarius salinarum TaxID=1981892 RepID=UPI000C324852|nr:hypothetical protein [Roseovarius salinarum]
MIPRRAPPAALAASLALLAAAPAPAAGPWEGTWDTRYGDLRLHQHRNIVVGDYDSFGLIVGIAEDGTLRGRFTNKRRAGQFTLHRDASGGLTGDWQWTGNRTGGDWPGEKADAAAPALGNIEIPSLTGLSNGMLTGTWETQFGPVRLVQVGDLFVGDYADRGIILGGRADDGTITGQFTNGQRVGEFSWTTSAGRVDGEYSISFDGTWAFLDGEGSGTWTGEKVDHDKPNLLEITGLPVEVMNDPVTEGALEEQPATPAQGGDTDAPTEGSDTDALGEAIRKAAAAARGDAAATQAEGPAAEVISRWKMDDSILGLQTQGGFRQFVVLEAPDPARVGRVVFRGWAAPEAPFVHGYARSFPEGCDPVDYPVAGLDLTERGTFTFLGFRPYIASDCSESGHIQSVQSWTRLD